MFKDPDKDKAATKTIPNPWNFDAPCYDERTKLSAGVDHGVGYTNPIGKSGSASMFAPTLPMQAKTIMCKDGYIEK